MRKIPLKYLPILGIVILLSIIGIFLFRANDDSLQRKIIKEIIPKEGFKSKNIKVTQTDPNKGATWVLEAKEFKYSKDGDKIQFYKFNINIEPEQDLHIELAGDKGEYNRKTNEINLYGDLKGVTNRGYSLFTDHILFKQKENYLKTDDKVTLIGPFFIIKGKGLFVDLKKETLKILSEVNSKIDKESLIL